MSNKKKAGPSKKKRKGEPRASGDDASSVVRPDPRVGYVIERDGKVIRTFDRLDDAWDQLFDESFPNPPENAEYRTREFDLMGGGTLFLIEERVPGTDRTRSVTIESSPASDEASTPPREPAIWKAPDREPGSPEYDVAVTFAGEDRAYVQEVVARLRDLGIKVFFDEDEQARLWGQNLLEELVDTYRARALRVLMFISRVYAEKAWPTQERRAALETAMKQPDEPYILPVRLDDVDTVPGFVGTTMMIDGRQNTAVKVADLTVEHLRGFGYKVPPPIAQQQMAKRVSVSAIPSQTPDGKWQADYEIHNGADHPIHDVVLVINDPHVEGDPADQMGTALELVIGTIAAGATERGHLDHLHFTGELAFGELPYLATVLFRDEGGNYWAASATGLKHRIYPPRIC